MPRPPRHWNIVAAGVRAIRDGVEPNAWTETMLYRLEQADVHPRVRGALAGGAKALARTSGSVPRDLLRIISAALSLEQVAGEIWPRDEVELARILLDAMHEVVMRQAPAAAEAA